MSVLSTIDNIFIICFVELSILLTIMLKILPCPNRIPETDLTLLSLPDLAKILPLRFTGTFILANEPLTPNIENDEK